MATIQQVAEAFAGHRYAEVYPFLHPEVTWTLVGAARLDGRDQVVEACQGALDRLAATSKQVLRFRTVAGPDAVVVDAVTRYVDRKWQSSFVASCDILEFDRGHLTAITSYTQEVDPSGL